MGKGRLEPQQVLAVSGPCHWIFRGILRRVMAVLPNITRTPAFKGCRYRRISPLAMKTRILERTAYA